MFGKKKTYQKKKLICREGKKRIYGEALIPEGDGPFPLLIYAHGCGFSTEILPMAAFANAGIAAYYFEFCGGCPWSNSSGDTKEMSAMTEAEDLNLVIDTLKQQPFVDASAIFLMGFEMGGLVATMAASKRPEDIRGLILFGPAFVLPDFQRVFLGGRPVPDTIRFSNMIVGRKFVEDIAGYDICADMKNYPGPVLLYQGAEDEVEPISYSEMAAQCFPNVKYHLLANAGRMLHAGRETQMEEEVLCFLNKNLR